MKSFAEILSEKLDRQASKTHTPFIEIDGNAPQHLAYLMGQLPKWEASQWSNLTEQKSRSLNQYTNQKSYQPKTTKPYQSAQQNEQIDVHCQVLNQTLKQTLNQIQKDEIKAPEHVLNTEQVKAIKYFTNLGASLTMNFSKEDLRSAFRKLALKVHPDRQPESQKEKATRTFQDLKVAYEQLKNCF